MGLRLEGFYLVGLGEKGFLFGAEVGLSEVVEVFKLEVFFCEFAIYVVYEGGCERRLVVPKLILIKIELIDIRHIRWRHLFRKYLLRIHPP